MSDAPSTVANATTPAMPSTNVPASIPSIQQIYAQERAKRLRPEGSTQFIDVSNSPRYRHFQTDPWADHRALNALEPALRDGARIPYLVIGGGYGGLVYAAKLIDAGVSATEIRIVDSAGGFGGTWYWNRYPGLMCDVESYMYMPLLEEMGYMPRHKYAYGEELRGHAERIAERWGVDDKALFRVDVKDLSWEEEGREWRVEMSENRGAEEGKRELTVHARVVFWACGVLHYPQIPKLLGFDSFKPRVFHSSRWDYSCTGGSPTDPRLEGLKGKTVGIIGTGATGVQIVPELAKWAKHLYVFQRTPSAVERRDQRATTPKEWKKITSAKKWQRQRSANYNAFTSAHSPLPDTNLVDDGWTHFPSYRAVVGGPTDGIITPADGPAFLSRLHAEDLERSTRIRARVDEVVNDASTATALKNWYPGWCKRPTFHDEYLPAFNLPNVTLVDTDGRGVEAMTSDAVVANGEEYPVDVLVLGTGYRSPAKGSPALRSNMRIHGRGGNSLEDVWTREGVETLHGVLAHGFPNLFFSGPSQVGVSPNQTFTLTRLAEHVAFIVSEARRRGGEGFVVEPTKESQADWSMQILMRATAFAGIAGCTPGYINSEGEADRLSDGEKMKKAKGAAWGEGTESFLAVIEGWRSEGELRGLELG